MRIAGPDETPVGFDGWPSSLLFGLVVATAVWAPIPFGSVEPWSLGILRIASLGILAVWALAVAVSGRLVVNSSPTQLVLLAALGLAVIQGFIPHGVRALESYDRFSTRQAAITLFCFTGYFAATLVAFDRPRRLRLAALLLFWLGFGLSVFGIIQFLSGTTLMYWIREGTGAFFGPFANKNHFAGLMELLMPLGAGLLLAGGIAREKRVMVGFASIIICLAIVLSGSRGGWISLVAEIAFLNLFAFVVGAGANTRSRTRSVVIGVGACVASLALVAVMVLWIGSERVADQLSTLPDEATLTTPMSRKGIWASTINLIEDHPVAGVGIGAYGTAINRYSGSWGDWRILHAHNDYLQTAADAGMFGVILAIVFVVLGGRAFFQAITSQNRTLKGVALGSGAACFGLMVHSVVDFNLQIPSNALTFLVALALLVRVGQLCNGHSRSEA